MPCGAAWNTRIRNKDEIRSRLTRLAWLLDASIPVEDVEALRARLAELDVPTEVLRYATAEHGFHCDARRSYNAEASTDAWGRALAWFEEHLA